MIRAALHKGDDENRGYSYAVDMWGCGVILYTLYVTTSKHMITPLQDVVCNGAPYTLTLIIVLACHFRLLSLVGFPPFWHSNRMVLMRLIMRGKFEFLSPYWDQVSDAAKDLVSKLLSTNPAQRLTATEAIVHPWMQPVPALVCNMGGSPSFIYKYMPIYLQPFVLLLFVGDCRWVRPRWRRGSRLRHGPCLHACGMTIEHDGCLASLS